MGNEVICLFVTYPFSHDLIAFLELKKSLLTRNLTSRMVRKNLYRRQEEEKRRLVLGLQNIQTISWIC
jgi:hypothetical protein